MQSNFRASQRIIDQLAMPTEKLKVNLWRAEYSRVGLVRDRRGMPERRNRDRKNIIVQHPSSQFQTGRVMNFGCDQPHQQTSYGHTSLGKPKLI